MARRTNPVAMKPVEKKAAVAVAVMLSLPSRSPRRRKRRRPRRRLRPLLQQVPRRPGSRLLVMPPPPAKYLLLSSSSLELEQRRLVQQCLVQRSPLAELTPRSSSQDLQLELRQEGLTVLLTLPESTRSTSNTRRSLPKEPKEQSMQVSLDFPLGCISRSGILIVIAIRTTLPLNSAGHSTHC